MSCVVASLPARWLPGNVPIAPLIRVPVRYLCIHSHTLILLLLLPIFLYHYLHTVYI